MSRKTISRKPILIVGSGRVAQHFCHYLQLKGHAFETWSRSKSNSSLDEIVSSFGLIFLAISDDALESVIEKIHTIQPSIQLVHFSGGRSFQSAVGIHPLMTFGHSLFEESFYDQIPLIIDHQDFQASWYKDLPNPKMQIRPDQKSLYHGLCHLAGNYPKFLWMEITKIFESEFHMPSSVLFPFLQEILKQSLSENPDRNTGVFARQDVGTIQSHLQALDKISHLKSAYEAFLNSYTTLRSLEAQS